jgi:hypothetical protein
MVKRKFGWRILFAAVLTRGVIAKQDVLARERSSLERNMDVLGQPDDRRGVNREFLRMQHVPIMLFDTRHTFKDHDYRAPLSAHVYRFKRGVQD